ncbi:MAG: hypothetical protein AAFO91_17230, partial [Bacteroidota bacterium]
VLVCQNVTYNLDANGEFTLFLGLILQDIIVSSTDNCELIDGQAGIGVSQFQFDCSNLGENEVRILNNDVNGNQNGCDIILTIADSMMVCNQSPVAVCQDVTVDADGNCEGNAAPEAFDEDSFDPDDDDLIFSLDQTGPFPLGTTDLVLTVSDGQEEVTCDVSITVEDNTAPVITCEDIDVFLDENGSAVIANDDAIISITDNCTDSMNLTGPFTIGGGNARTFGCGDIGNPRTIMVIATDESDNTDTCTYVATTFDTVRPILVCPTMVTAFLDEMGADTVTNSEIGFTASDNCGTSGPIARIIGGNGARRFFCDNVGMSFNRQFYVDDVNGNQSDTCTVSIEVRDRS